MTRWSAASIRVRLTAWYALVLALMMVVYATATFVAVRHEFLEQFDDQLHDDFEAAVGYLSATDDGRVAWSGESRHDPDNDQDRGSDVWLASGHEVYRSGASASLPPVAQLRRFTADASHELRTPLAVIRGIGEAGLGETRTPAEYKEAMGSMLEEVDRLTNLVDTLLRLSRGDAGTVRLARNDVDMS